MSQGIGRKKIHGLSRRESRKRERGSALLVVLLVTTILVILNAGFLAAIFTEKLNTAKASHSSLAMQVAEAGIEFTIWELNYGGADFLAQDGWSGTTDKSKSGTLTTEDGEALGEYDVTVYDPTSATPEIEATSYVPSEASSHSSRTVRVWLEETSIPLFSMAAFGINGVGLDTGVITDSYNSTVGPYGGANIGNNGDVGTNSIATSPAAISLGGTATIHGDASIGLSGDPNAAISGGTITGSKLAASATYNPPSMNAPPGLPNQGSIILGSHGTAVISGDAQFSTIDIGQHSIITVDADAIIHITNTLHFDQNSQLRITNGANVSVYVDGSMTFDQGSSINNVSQDPLKFGLIGTDSMVNQVQFDQAGAYYGTIYAPNAAVQLDRDTIVYGAVLGQSIQLDRNSTIHFDEALLDGGAGGGNDYAVSTWLEKI